MKKCTPGVITQRPAPTDYRLRDTLITVIRNNCTLLCYYDIAHAITCKWLRCIIICSINISHKRDIIAHTGTHKPRPRTSPVPPSACCRSGPPPPLLGEVTCGASKRRSGTGPDGASGGGPCRHCPSQRPGDYSDSHSGGFTWSPVCAHDVEELGSIRRDQPSLGGSRPVSQG